MAAGDLNFNVGVDTAGAIRSVQNLNTSLNGLKNAFGLLTAGISVGVITGFADSITSLKNRLMLVSDSQEQANTQFKALAAIAIEARTELAATGDLYFRIARNAKELGISQYEAGQITESLAKAMSASGLSARESAGPLLQLGQALQSGVFQGDELRSILEGLPPVARALAEQLNVPIGALKKMGSEGLITSQDFVQAMRRARDAIEQDFAKTVPTISQAFNQLKSTMALVFNEFETNTQTGRDLAAAIEYVAFTFYQLSKRMDEFGQTIKEGLKIVLLIATFTLLGRVVLFVWNTIMGLGAAFVAVGRFIGAASTKIVEFISTFKPIGGFIQEVIKKVIAATATLASALGLAPVINFFKDTYNGIVDFVDGMFSAGDASSKAGQDLEEFRKELAKLKDGFNKDSGKPAPPFLDPQKIRQARQEFEQIVLTYQRQNQEQIKRLEFENQLIGATEQQRQVRQVLFDLENSYFNEINRLLDEYRKNRESNNKEDLAKLPMIQKAIQAVSDSYAVQIERVRELTTENFTLAEAERQRLALAEYSIRSQIDQTRNLQKIQDDIAKMTMSELEKKYYDIDVAARESARSAIEAENSRRRSLKLAEMTTEEEQKYYEQARRGTDELKQRTTELYENSRKFSTGWRQAFNEFVDNATNAANAAESLFRKATQGMEDALVNFVKTGKFEFKNFVNMMLEELLRLQIRQTMASIFTGINNSGKGSSNMLGSLLGFANGGIIPTNAPVVVGERGPEIISGAAGRTVIPNNALGQSTSVTYNINAVDARSFKEMIAADPSFIHAVASQGAKSTPGRR